MFGNIARSKGMTEVAEKAGVVRQSLYRALSPESRKGRLGHSTGCAFALGGRVRAASRRNGNCRIVPAGTPDWQLREIQHYRRRRRQAGGAAEYQRVSGAGRWCGGAEPVVVGGLD